METAWWDKLKLCDGCWKGISSSAGILHDGRFLHEQKEERIFVMSAPDSHSTFTSVMVGSLYIRVQALNFTETIDDLPFGGRPIDEPPYFISPPAEPSQNRTTRI